MGVHKSTPEFRTHHALRIKGFATVEVVSEVSALELETVERHLDCMRDEGQAQFRDARSLWQLTPEGRETHQERLVADLEGAPLDELSNDYRVFFECNSEFKQLCTDWQLRDGEPNDHSDATYDRTVLGRLDDLHAEALPVVSNMGDLIERLSPYAPRLERSLGRVREGDQSGFTGVMCGSYHDVWMELHEDLILTQGIDRAVEGSF